MGVLSWVGLLTKRRHNEILQDAVDKFNKHLTQQVALRTMMVDESIGQIVRVSVDEAEQDRSGPLAVRLEFPRSFAFGLAQGDEQVAGFVIQRMATRIGRAMGAVVSPSQGPTGDPFVGGF